MSDQSHIRRGRAVAATTLVIDTRPSLERHLHDGAQLHLVAVKVELAIARQLTERDSAGGTTIIVCSTPTGPTTIQGTSPTDTHPLRSAPFSGVAP